MVAMVDDNLPIELTVFRPLAAKLEEFGAGYESYIDSVTRSRDEE